jgi:hypothetical protein
MSVKTCPSCSFTECFVKATACEKCGHKFGSKVPAKPKTKPEPKAKPAPKPQPAKVVLEEVNEPVKSEPMVIKKYNPRPVAAFDETPQPKPEKVEKGKHANPLFTDPPKLDPNWDIFSSLIWLHEYKSEEAISDWIERIVTQFQQEFGIHLVSHSLHRLASMSKNPALQAISEILSKNYPPPKIIEGVFHFLGMFTGDNIDKEPNRLLSNGTVRQLVRVAQAKL